MNSRLPTAPPQHKALPTSNGAHPPPGKPITNGYAPAPGPALPASDDDLGVRLSFNLASLVIAIGTTAGEAGHRVIRRVIETIGGTLPPLIRYLLIDSDGRKNGWNPQHAFIYGVDGIGTVPTEGRKAFLERWDELRGLISARIDQLVAAADVRHRMTAPLRAIDIYVIAGPGGTGGGGLDLLITLIHQIAHERGIEEPRVHVILLGPEMPLRDRTRSLSSAQYDLIPATFGANCLLIVNNVVSPEIIQESPPTGPAFQLEACHRVYTVTALDWSNGSFSFSVTEAFLDMVADSLFLRIFTQLAADLAALDRDNRVTGLKGFANL